MAKRGQGEGTISKRPDGTWWARISLGKDANGKQKRKAFYGATRKEVQEKLTAALNELNTDTYIEPSKMTVARWMDTWLKEYKYHSVKPHTYESYYSMAKCHIKPRLGQTRLKDLRKDMVQRFVNDLFTEGKGPSYVESVFRVLNGALKEAVDGDLIAKNPATGVRMPRKEKQEMRILTPEEQLRFIETAKLYDLGEVFILMLGTGMRIGEALALTWDDINFENAEIRVNKTQTEYIDPHEKKPKLRLSYGTPKTQSSYRTIPLLPQLVEMLKDHREKQNAQASEMGSAYTDNNLVFCARFGTGLWKCNMQYKLMQICQKANIDGLHSHCLRHTFATRGLENGIPLKVMQELLGHSKISMTADTYSHVLPDTKRTEVAKLSGTITLGA